MKKIITKLNLFQLGTILLLFGLINTLKASSVSDSLERKLSGDIALSGEYNNNVYLKDRNNPDHLPDYIFHLNPKVNYNQSYKRQLLGLYLNGDIRKGIKEVPLQANLTTSGFVDLNLKSLRLKVKDYYRQSDFDIALFDFPNIQNRRRNSFNTNLSYTIQRNLSLYGKCANEWFTYYDHIGKFNSLKSIFGGGLDYVYSNRVKMKIDYSHSIEQYELPLYGLLNNISNKLDSRLMFPISNNIDSYLSYQYGDQNSVEYVAKNFTDHQALYGVKWDRNHKIIMWMDGGYEYLQYLDNESHFYKGIVGNLGYDYQLTNNISSKGLLGIDIFRNLVADFNLRYHLSEKVKLAVFAKRKTVKHLLLRNYGDSYIYNNYRASITTYLSELFKLTTGIRYSTRGEFSDEFNFQTGSNLYEVLDINLTTTMKLDFGSINFKGGFLQYDKQYVAELKSINRLLYTKMWGEYIFSEHYKPGVYLLYARRYSSDEINTFENLRIGFSFSYLF